MSEKKKSSCLGLGCGGVILIAVCIGVTVFVISPDKKDSPTIQTSESSATNSESRQASAEDIEKKAIQDAYYASRRYIQNSLKAPSTAKFSNILTDTQTTGASKDGVDRIKCWGVVEAKNEFGVPLRESWVTVVQEESDKWLVVYARLGDQVLMEARETNKTQKILNAEEFIGMTYEQMISTMGQPLETKAGSNAEDGGFKIYSYSIEKGKETYFTIWDSDGLIDNGMYQGTYFYKK